MNYFAAIIDDPNIPFVEPEILLANAINIFLWLIGIMAVGMIIFAAIQMITSGGDVEKAKNGRRALMWGIVGLIIALSAAIIVNLVIGII